MAGSLSFLVCAISFYAQYVSGQVSASASAAVSTFNGQLVPAHVYPPLTVTGKFPWYVPLNSLEAEKATKTLQLDCQFVHDLFRLRKLVCYIPNLDMHSQLWQSLKWRWPHGTKSR